MSSSSTRLVVLEIAVSLAIAALFVLSCANIHVDPFDRLGQVSAIAAVELRALGFGAAMLLALLIALKTDRGARFEHTSRFVAAAIAGLSSGILAGGILVMLHRAPFGLGALNGDIGALIEWADKAKHGEVGVPFYPPLQIHLLVWISDIFGMPTAYASKWFQIAGVAIVGPFAYASWRLLLRPSWAAGVGILTSLPLLEPYRQYPLLALIVFLPVTIKFLDVLRTCAEEPVIRLVRYGALFGLAFGILFLLYSGWFKWSAPGFFVAAVALAPWRRHGWKAVAILCGVAALVFTILSFRYLEGVLQTSIRDDFIYFDALVEPAYMATWRGGMPGNVGVWPPIGELGGVGLFTLLLATGTGAAIVLGRTRTVVIATGSMMAGAWAWRFWYAHLMWRTKLVQLYPRTTPELLYGALVLCAFAIYFWIERARPRAPADSPLHRPAAFVGVFVTLFYISMSSSSATIDKYMPREDIHDPGYLAWSALKQLPFEVSQARDASIDVSSSDEDPPRQAASYVVDRKLDRGYSSAPVEREDHEEWVVLHTPTAREFSTIIVHPAPDGFPVDFALEVWDGAAWVPRVNRTNYPAPSGPQKFALGEREVTDRVRLHATKLRKTGDKYRLRVMEIELYH